LLKNNVVEKKILDTYTVYNANGFQNIAEIVSNSCSTFFTAENIDKWFHAAKMKRTIDN